MEKFNDFEILKYRKCIYLIKNLIETNDSLHGKYQVNYYFRITFKSGSKLYNDSSEVHYEHNLKYYKNASREEIKFLINEIQNKFPEFNINNINSLDDSKTKVSSVDDFLTEKDCIEFLKNRGYLIYKNI